MSHSRRRSNCNPTESCLSVVAMMAMDRARSQGIDTASVPVRELEAQAERILRESGGFWGLVAEVAP